MFILFYIDLTPDEVREKKPTNRKTNIECGLIT